MNDHPRHPTFGWVRSELDRLGVSNRGSMTDAQAFAKLKSLGYDIRDGPASKSTEDDPRLAPQPEEKSGQDGPTLFDPGED